MDTMTQQNAAMVEESTTAAEEMRHHAEHLNERINSFVLGEDEPQQQARGSNSAMQGSALSAHTPSHSSSQSSPAKHAADEWEAF